MTHIGRPRKNFDFPSYKGGHTRLSPYGHVLEYCPDHPACSKIGYVPQHRLVMEAHVMRYLSGNEIVHHIDGNKQNNSIENLELLPSRAAHRALHNRLRRANLNEGMVREALQGRSTKEAAKLLGVHHQTLRNRFDCLLSKRRSPHDLDDPDVVSLVRDAAASDQIGIKVFAKQTGIGAQTIKKICDRNQIEWVPKCRKGYKHHHKKSTPLE